MRKLPKTISEAKFIEGFKQVKKHHIKLAFILGFYQCLRVSEVVALSKKHIDLKRGFISIKQAKGCKDRDIPIMKPVRSYLKYLPVGVGVRALQKQVKKYWPEIKFHSLRHSGATFYLNEKGVDIRFIQQLLGHSRLDTTQIYTHVTPKNLRSVFDNVW